MLINVYKDLLLSVNCFQTREMDTRSLLEKTNTAVFKNISKTPV